MNRLNKKILAVILVVICTFLTATGLIFLKIGANKLVFDASILANYNLWIGFVLYGFGALFLILSFRQGNLSLVHPFLSLGIVWSSLLAFFYLNESFPLLKIAGICIIIIGTFLIFRGDAS